MASGSDLRGCIALNLMRAWWALLCSLVGKNGQVQVLASQTSLLIRSWAKQRLVQSALSTSDPSQTSFSLHIYRQELSFYFFKEYLERDFEATLTRPSKGLFQDTEDRGRTKVLNIKINAWSQDKL